MRLIVLITLIYYCLAYTPDGVGNNVNNPSWGSKGRTFYTPYPSNTRIGSISDLPNPRHVSNTIAATYDKESNTHGVNLLETMFGQFINHDIQSTLRSAQPLILPLPADDVLNGVPGTPQIGQNQWAIIVNNTVLDNTGNVINDQTSWFDLSTIYGTSNIADLALRNTDGTLKMSSQYACKFPPPPFGDPTQALCNSTYRVTFDNLPPSTLQVPQLGKPDINFPPRFDGTGVFNDADFRINSNVALTMIHTLYKREHNRIVAELRASHPHLSGNELYNRAKAKNIAQYQYHVFEEYLPTIVPNIGRRLKRYSGYNPNLIPDTSYDFDFGAFRYGHSAFKSYKVVDKFNTSFTVVPDWYMQLNPYQDPQKFVFAGTSGPEPFLIPDVLSAARKEENIWYSLIYTPAGKVDTTISDDLRNLGRGFFPIDLFAIDILRGRVANISTYYALRQRYHAKYNFGIYPLNAEIYGRPGCASSLKNSVANDSIACFNYITNDSVLSGKLFELYGKVTKIDAVVGLLAERTMPKYRLPTTIAHIVFTEYNRKRLSDRYWYENVLNSREIDQLLNFKEILIHNFNIDHSLRGDDIFMVSRTDYC